MLSENKVMQSLWVGSSLSPMEQLSIRSYIRQGHDYHLYTYEQVTNVPSEVVTMNANEIIPLATMHYSKFPKLALFADFFRYKLLLDKGGWWTDTDAVCIKPFDFPLEYVFSSEVESKAAGGAVHINNGTIKAPKNSHIIRHCWEKCLAMDIPNIPWGDSGPALVKAAVKIFRLEKYVQSPEVFCPIPWWDVPKFIDPAANLRVPSGSYAVHLWNFMWSEHKMNKGVFPPGSFYERLNA